MKPIYSVVIPLKNEVENIGILIDEIEQVMEPLDQSWELICIDDGSVDGTGDLLQKLSSQKPFLRFFAFDRNYGQSSAFDAGFKKARGDYVITLDGDGQNDPKDIPALIELIPECDMVCGIRLKRKDSFIKKMTSKIANFVRNMLVNDGMQDTGCSLKIYRKTALDKIKMYQGLHRFLPALFKIEGCTVLQVPVNHRERQRGKSNYNFFNRSFNTISDLFAVRWMKKRHLHYKIQHDRDN